METKAGEETRDIVVVVDHEPGGLYDAPPGACVEDMVSAVVVDPGASPIVVWIEGKMVHGDASLDGVSEVVLSVQCLGTDQPVLKSTVVERYKTKRETLGHKSLVYSRATPIDSLSAPEVMEFRRLQLEKREHPVHGRAVVFGAAVHAKATLEQLFKQAIANDVLMWVNLFRSLGLPAPSIHAAHGPSATEGFLKDALAEAAAEAELEYFALVLEGDWVPVKELSDPEGTTIRQKDVPVKLRASAGEASVEAIRELVAKVRAKRKFVFVHGRCDAHVNAALRAPKVADEIRKGDDDTIVVVGFTSTDVNGLHVSKADCDAGSAMHVQRKNHAGGQGWCRGILTAESAPDAFDLTFEDKMIGRNVLRRQMVHFQYLALIPSIVTAMALNGTPPEWVHTSFHAAFTRTVWNDVVEGDAEDFPRYATTSAMRKYLGQLKLHSYSWAVSAGEEETRIPIPGVLPTLENIIHPSEGYVGESFLDVRSDAGGGAMRDDAGALLVGSSVGRSDCLYAQYSAAVKNDVATMASVCKSPHLFCMNPDRVDTLVGRGKVNPEAVVERIRAVAARSEASPLDQFVFFFTGQGVRERGNVSLMVGHDVLRGADLMKELQGIRTNNLVVIINGCFSGGIGKHEVSDGMMRARDGDGKCGNLWVFCSSSPSEISQMSFVTRKKWEVGDVGWVQRKRLDFNGSMFSKGTLKAIRPGGTLDMEFTDGYVAEAIPPEQCSDLGSCRGMFTSFLVSALQGAHTCPLFVPDCSICAAFRGATRLNATKAQMDRDAPASAPTGVARVTDIMNFLDGHFHTGLPVAFARPFSSLVGSAFALCAIPLPRGNAHAAPAVPRPPLYAMRGHRRIEGEHKMDGSLDEAKNHSSQVLCVRGESEAALANFMYHIVGRLDPDTVPVTHYCEADDPLVGDTTGAAMIAKSLAFQMEQGVSTFGEHLRVAMGLDIGKYFDEHDGHDCIRAILLDALCCVKAGPASLMVIMNNAHKLPAKTLALIVRATEARGFPAWARIVLTTTAHLPELGDLPTMSIE